MWDESLSAWCRSFTSPGNPNLREAARHLRQLRPTGISGRRRVVSLDRARERQLPRRGLVPAVRNQPHLLGKFVISVRLGYCGAEVSVCNSALLVWAAGGRLGLFLSCEENCNRTSNVTHGGWLLLPSLLKCSCTWSVLLDLTKILTITKHRVSKCLTDFSPSVMGSKRANYI